MPEHLHFLTINLAEVINHIQGWALMYIIFNIVFAERESNIFSK